MDLRQRDPFERKFAELIVRFRSIGFLLIIALLVTHLWKRSEPFINYLVEISSQLKMIGQFIAYHGFDINVLTTHWDIHQAYLIVIVALIPIVPIVRKQWSSLPIILSSYLIVLGLILLVSCSSSSWLLWAWFGGSIALAILARLLKFSLLSYLATWSLGLGLGFIQLAQLSEQIGLEHFILYPQWMYFFLVTISAMVMTQIFQLTQVNQDPKVMNSASLLVNWYSKYLKLYLWSDLIVMALILIGLIPAFGFSGIYVLYFALAVFQIQVLHLVLLPMIVNLLTFFPKKS